MAKRNSTVLALLNWASHRRKRVSVALHAVLFSISLLIAFGLATNFDKSNPWLRVVAFQVLIPVVLIKLVVFQVLGMWRGSWRYVGLRDLLSLIVASITSTFVLVIVYYIAENISRNTFHHTLFEGGTLPESIILLDWAATIGLVAAARMAVRMYYEEYRTSPPGSVKRVLIVGAGDAGEALLRELLRVTDQEYDVIGFLDESPSRIGNRIHGVEVLGTPDVIQEVCEEAQVDEVLIALPNATQRQIRSLIERCQGRHLRFQIIPQIADVIEGRVKVSQLREVSIEDLLGRDPVELDSESIENYVRNRQVLVTGAGGSIGSEMCRQLARFKPASMALVEQAENNLFHIERELRRTFPDQPVHPYVADICDRARIDAILDRVQPSVIFHAAAHKHVPMMEINAGEAVKNNVLGTRTIADAAVRAGVEKMVMISTDKAVNPTSIMGCSKRVAEIYVQELSDRAETQFVTVRFGNVLGSSGSVIPIFKEQIAAGGPVTVTHPDMLRYFMTIPEAAQLVLQAGAMGAGGEIFLLDMGDPVRILDLANDLITLSGLRPGDDIEIKFTGVRPGEKLVEELSIEGEDVSRTRHPKIGIWRRRPEDWDAVRLGIDELVASADRSSTIDIRRMLGRLVPEYTPDPLADDNGGRSPKAAASTPAAPSQAG